MNRVVLLRTCLWSVRRNMCTQPPGGSTPTASTAAGTAATSSSSTRNMNFSPKYRPSEFQKFILVWTKKFKSKAEIPTFVSPDLIERSRSEARIKIANVLMLLTALASLGAVLSGKAAAKRGESVHQINKDFHRQYQENYEKEQKAATN